MGGTHEVRNTLSTTVYHMHLYWNQHRSCTGEEEVGLRGHHKKPSQLYIPAL